MSDRIKREIVIAVFYVGFWLQVFVMALKVRPSWIEIAIYCAGFLSGLLTLYGPEEEEGQACSDRS